MPYTPGGLSPSGEFGLQGACCPICRPVPTPTLTPCDEVSCPVPGCEAGFEMVTPDGQCCPICQPPPTSVPTPAPTPAPSMAPTGIPTPTLIATTFTYCPEGYTNIGDRWNQGLGRITVVQSHQECADRCLRFAGVEFNGGCKGYMTGQYYRMLLCRSYGGGLRATPCAPWATPENKGIGSGLDNVGGNCCTRVPTLNEHADGPWPQPPPT